MGTVGPQVLLADWLERFALIETDVQNILLRRQVFRRLGEIIAANPRLHRPSYLYEYLVETYAASAAIAVRRHVRHDSRDRERSSGLISLLYAIRATPGIITRARHIALYAEAGMPADMAEDEFDDLVEPGAAHLGPRHVQRDVGVLLDVSHDLERYATQRIAHLDREEPTVIPKFGDLDRALDVFEQLVKRYRWRPSRRRSASRSSTASRSPGGRPTGPASARRRRSRRRTRHALRDRRTCRP